MFMPIIPDLEALRAAASAVDRTAAEVDADATLVASRLEAIPWRGPRRDRALVLVDEAVRTGRRQAEAERALARALRELAGAVERELRELAVLAAQARRHLEELLARARALVTRAAQELSDVAATAATFVWELATGDAAGAVVAARELVRRAEECLRSITLRLHGLPEPSDPLWRSLAPEIVRWQPL